MVVKVENNGLTIEGTEGIDAKNKKFLKQYGSIDGIIRILYNIFLIYTDYIEEELEQIIVQAAITITEDDTRPKMFMCNVALDETLYTGMRNLFKDVPFYLYDDGDEIIQTFYKTQDYIEVDDFMLYAASHLKRFTPPIELLFRLNEDKSADVYPLAALQDENTNKEEALDAEGEITNSLMMKTDNLLDIVRCYRLLQGCSTVSVMSDGKDYALVVKNKGNIFIEGNFYFTRQIPGDNFKEISGEKLNHLLAIY